MISKTIALLLTTICIYNTEAQIIPGKKNKTALSPKQRDSFNLKEDKSSTDISFQKRIVPANNSSKQINPGNVTLLRKKGVAAIY